MITLIGMGSGTPESLTAQGLAALQNAGLILGAKRLLEQLHQPAKAKRHGKRCRTHGRIAGQPPAPQGLRRMICLLQLYHLPV